MSTTGTAAGTSSRQRPAPGAVAPRRGGVNRLGAWPWVFIAPAGLGILVFYLYPIVQTVLMSFQTYGPFGGGEFVGIDNYTNLLQDPRLPRALVNTVVYTLIVMVSIPISMFFASLIQRPGMRFTTLFRVLFFMPYLAMPTAISFVFRVIFNGDFGALNWLLGLVGIDGPYWLSTEWFALGAVGIMGMWGSMGFNILIMLAGLANIPPDLYEAASLDGASGWSQFTHITVPGLRASIFLVTIMTVIHSFQLFDGLYALLGTSNPVMPKTQSIVYLFYDQAFVQQDRGYAAAVALLIMLIIGLVTLVQFRANRRNNQ